MTMIEISVGKLRGLQHLANSNGIMAMCAADHRESLARALNPANPNDVSYQEIVDFKLDLCQAVAPFASGILLDPIYGASQAIANGVLPGSIGLLVSMEKTGYAGTGTRRTTEMLPDWDVKKAKRMGASGAKILLYYRPD